jgi:hypothetical protein
MAHNRPTRSTSQQSIVAPPRGRRGAVPLEFAMALPLLLMVLFIILGMGSHMITWGETAIANRNAVWRQRADADGTRPLHFEDLGLLTGADQQAGDWNMFAALLPAASTHHAVLGGAWDHRDLPLDRPPHWQLYAEAARIAARSDLATRIGEIKQIVGDFRDAVTGAFDGATSGDVVNQQLGSTVANLQNVLGFKDDVELKTSTEKQAAVDRGRTEVLPRMESKEAKLAPEVEIRLPDEINRLKAAITVAAGGINWARVGELIDAAALERLRNAAEALGRRAEAVTTESETSDVSTSATTLSTAVDEVGAALEEPARTELVALTGALGLVADATTLDADVKDLGRKRKELALTRQAIGNFRNNLPPEGSDGGGEFNSVPDASEVRP